MFWSKGSGKRLAELDQQRIASDTLKREMWESDTSCLFEDGIAIRFEDGKAQFFIDGSPVTTELTFNESRRLQSAMNVLHDGIVKPAAKE